MVALTRSAGSYRLRGKLHFLSEQNAALLHFKHVLRSKMQGHTVLWPWLAGEWVEASEQLEERHEATITQIRAECVEIVTLTTAALQEERSRVAGNVRSMYSLPHISACNTGVIVG